MESSVEKRFDKYEKPYIKLDEVRQILMNSPEAVKQTLASHGMTIREWAAARGFSESLVYAVLAGKNKASRGESFRIAVALGLRQEPPVSAAPSYVAEVLALRGSPDAAKQAQEGRMT